MFEGETAVGAAFKYVLLLIVVAVLESGLDECGAEFYCRNTI
jgi:hypothetical protein